MLERKLAYPDSTTYLPYTVLCFINNAELPPDYGWLMDYNIKESQQRSLLIIEMNSSEIMGYAYSSGSVQFVIEVPQFSDFFEFDMASDKIKIHLINNYGGLNSTDETPTGTLSLIKVDSKIKISGKVTLKRSNPDTKQVVHFHDDLIPNFNLEAFLTNAKKRERRLEKEHKKMVDFFTRALMEDKSPIDENKKEQIEEVQDNRTLGQGFKLSYSVQGLGSNRWEPCRIIVAVQDSILSYGVMELSQELSSISFSTGDTTFKDKRVWYEVPFTSASKDSILALMTGKEGQYIFDTNPYIMSGGIAQIYIEYEGWCIEMNLKNVYNETENALIRILNHHLPKESRLNEMKKEDWNMSENEPLVKECTGQNSNSYRDVLELEYESILKQSTVPKKK